MRQHLGARMVRWGLVAAMLAGCSAANPPAARDAAAATQGEGEKGDGPAPGHDARVPVGTEIDAAGQRDVGAGGIDGPDGGPAGPDAPPVARDFRCTELVGLGSTREWYNAGFETFVVDARWQLRWHHRGYVEDWADVKNPYWGTYCDHEGCSRVSACAEGADSPDRVVFVVLNWIYTTEQQWEADVRRDVEAIATKYPGVRNIELISSSRCPDRCTTIEPPGTMDELTAVQTCRTPAVVDEAIAAVAAMNPALVTVGPRFFTDDWAAFVSLHGPHLTTKGQKEIAAKAGAYYAAHP